MKILVSAIACNPLNGSEPAVGWNFISTLSKHHELWVFLKAGNRRYFETWSQTHTLPSNIHLHYIGEDVPCHPNRMVARIQSWLDYSAWQKLLLEPAQKLHREVGFDLVHHVTYATWRMASPLWQLGLPFVWGPLGGGEIFPWRLTPILSPVAKAFEIIRAASNFVSRHHPAIRACARHATVCIASNRETFELLAQLKGGTEGVEICCNSFFPEEKIAPFRELLPGKTHDGPLRLLAGGNLEGRKGVSIALQGLAKIRQAGIPFAYQLGGIGPELHHLQQLAKELDIAPCVDFGLGFSGDAYRNELIRSHIYLLPSLRENAGITLMEAMLAGCVPIVADGGGPGDIVTDDCGFRIKITNQRQMATDIAQAITRLNEDRALLARMGAAAHERIASNYNATRYEQLMEGVYRKAMALK